MASNEESEEKVFPLKEEEEELTLKCETIETAKPGVTITIRAPSSSDINKTSLQNVAVVKTDLSNGDFPDEDDDETGSPGQNRN